MQKNGRTMFIGFLLVVWVPAIGATAWLTYRIGRLEGKIETHINTHDQTKNAAYEYPQAD
jgi:hypothetical protein